LHCSNDDDDGDDDDDDLFSSPVDSMTPDLSSSSAKRTSLFSKRTDGSDSDDDSIILYSTEVRVDPVETEKHKEQNVDGLVGYGDGRNDALLVNGRRETTSPISCASSDNSESLQIVPSTTFSGNGINILDESDEPQFMEMHRNDSELPSFSKKKRAAGSSSQNSSATSATRQTNVSAMRKINLDGLRRNMCEREILKKQNKKWKVTETYENPSRESSSRKRKRNTSASSSWKMAVKKDKEMDNFIVDEDEESSDAERGHAQDDVSDQMDDIELVTTNLEHEPAQHQRRGESSNLEWQREEFNTDSPSSSLPSRALYAQQTLLEKLSIPHIKPTQPLEVYFAWYVRFLIAATHPFLGESFQTVCEDKESHSTKRPFQDAVRQVERSMNDKINHISSNWNPTLKQTLKQLPFVDIEVNRNNECREQCKACGKSHTHTDCLLTFRGSAYIPINQKNVTLIRNKKPSTSQPAQFHFGSSCTLQVLLFHLLYHFKFHAISMIRSEWKDVKSSNFAETESISLLERKVHDHLAAVWDYLDNLCEWSNCGGGKNYNLQSLKDVGKAMCCIKSVQCEAEDLTHTTDEDTPVKRVPTAVTEVGDSDSSDDEEMIESHRQRSPRGKSSCFDKDHQRVLTDEQRHYLLHDVVSSPATSLSTSGFNPHTMLLQTKPKPWDVTVPTVVENGSSPVIVSSGASPAVAAPSSQTSYDFDDLLSATQKVDEDDDEPVHVIGESGERRRVDVSPEQSPKPGTADEDILNITL